MAAKKTAKPAAKQKKAKVVREVPADVYVCIRRCFFQDRIWTPKRTATREKDYLLTVAPGTVVSPKNFLKVESVPEFAPEVPEEKALAFSEIQAKDVSV